MRAKDSVRLGVIRGLIAAAMNEAVVKGKGPDGILTEEEMLAVVTRAAKQRKDSIEQFEKGGRADLAEPEKAELVIVMTMLPAQMSQDEIVAAAKAKAAELGLLDPDGKPLASSGAGKTGANKLMGMLMKDLKGRADGNDVKAVVDGMFS